MGQMHARFTYANAMATIAALAAALAVALIAASPAHAFTVCTPSGTPGGGPGDDCLIGTSASETISGKAGNDQLFGSFGNDLLDGGDGADTLDGSNGNDILIGGPGFGDRFAGDSGNDDLRLRDGTPDFPTAIDCGPGTDSVDLDLLDAAQLTGVTLVTAGAVSLVGFSCEHITVGAVNEGPNVVISAHSVNVGTDGRAAVRLRCPASLPAPCAGTLRLGHSAKSQGKKVHYSIDQGKKNDVSARLSHRDRRRLSRHGQTSALVTSVEQGEFGDKTTIQTIKLIAQD
jgi:hypothetical protein